MMAGYLLIELMLITRSNNPIRVFPAHHSLRHWLSFPHHSCTYASIEFQIDGNILVVSEQEDLPWVKGYHLIHERITPGFPGKILRRASQEELDRIHQRHRERQTWLSQSPTEDPRRNRTLFVTGNKILTSTGIPGERKLLAEFLREPFEAFEPPDWAHKW